MPDGQMTWKVDPVMKLGGYLAYGTIVFSYSFPNGKKKDGTAYSGTSRTAYLPMSPEGIEVFHMMVEAFRRRLTFIVGTSLTTGK